MNGKYCKMNDFIELMREVMSDSEIERFVASIENEAAVKSIRLNERKNHESHDTLEPVKWCPFGRYVAMPDGFRFVDDVAFHAGAYYVQEASSMFLWQVLQQKVEKRAVVFDACAAPGGKSTLIDQYIDDEGFLVSNEFVAKRSNVLVENLMKWGRDNWLVTNEGLGKFEQLGEMFDAVVVDAPCSGEGMFRKDEEAVGDWSVENVMMCQTRQREIVRSAWATLKENGIMVYSTCTYNALEDEENVEWIVRELGGEVEDVALDESWGLVRARSGGYHFFPHRVKGEGLFMAVIRKRDGSGIERKQKRGDAVKWEKMRAEWLQNADDYSVLAMHDTFWAIRNSYKPIAAKIISAGLNVRACGVEYGMTKGKEMIPAPGLALSMVLDRSRFQILELSHEDAMKYLRCEVIPTGDTERGVVLVMSGGYALGWAKNVGNRCNNMYPVYWRIRN